MSTSNGSSVLAIGIDAAEATLVKYLIEQDEMPALKSLFESGRWLSVQSPANIGSGTVWPTFATGEEPTSHGIYSEWKWQPETMSLQRYQGHHLIPFWKSLTEQGISIGVLDVPFTSPVGVSKGFEVSEWWAHDSTGAGLRASPDKILSIAKQSPTHPLSANRFFNATPDRTNNLKDLTAACIEGAKIRGALAQRLISDTKPQLSLVVFPEVHHASHQMWHTVEPNHMVYNGRYGEDAPEPLLRDVYRAVDQQIAGLIEVADSNATLMVFALHGFRPALGFPAFLGPLLTERGFSRLANWSSQSWTKRALSMFAAAKRHSPAALRKLYYALAPITATHALARPTMLPDYDFANTRAFSLPTDQYGWIRINLTGREAQGIVPLEEYNEICSQLEELLLELKTDDGQLLVQDVTRTSANPECARANPLPDLVVHWRDAAFSSPLKIRSSKVEVDVVSKKSTGQHASEGFCIYRGNQDLVLEGVISAKDLGRLMAANLA